MSNFDNALAVTAELKRCSIACRFGGKLFEVNKNLDASACLVQLAQDFCEQNHIDLMKIDRIITASGPGSFTGIRTAQSFVKGVALALKVSAVCASYFQVIKNIFRKEFGRKDDPIAIIRSEKNQVYFHDFSTGNFGVSPYESLEKMLSSESSKQSMSNRPLAGDKIGEILQNTRREFIEVKNYRDAKNFLELTEFEPKVSPLYINAQIQRIR